MDDLPQTVTVFAPAKINLFLHITGRRGDGYHDLDSLVSFADIGDQIVIEKSDQFHFSIDGPFAHHFKERECDQGLHSHNIVARAAKSMSQTTSNAPDIKITLTKNLPLASGLGGGSSDAAATIWGLQKLWGLRHDTKYIPPLLKNLGADVPVCMGCEPAIIRGIGDDITIAPFMPEMPVLLVNPMIPCPTPDVFLNFNSPFKNPTTLPIDFSQRRDVIDILKHLNNDLLEPALKTAPTISNVLNALGIQGGCNLARMSGSGSTCFALFETLDDAQKAEEQIKQDNPDWWVKSGWLNRTVRY